MSSGRPRDLSALLAELQRGPAPSAAERPARKANRRRVLALVAMGAALGAGLAARAPWPSADRGRESGPSVAVLPFEDLSPGRDHQYFADGLAEEILGRLARVRGLRVAGRTSSFSFRGGARTDVARDLEVGTVLSGTVRRAGARLRITAELVDARTSLVLWVEEYDRDLADVLATQDEIAGSVARTLNTRLAPREPGAGHVPGPEAYDQVLIGRQAARSFTDEGRRRALAAFERAVALDPAYAPGWAGLALALAEQPARGLLRSRTEVDLAQARALAAAERAVALDPGLADAWFVRGMLRTFVVWDYPGACRDTERALALQPGNPEALRGRAFLLALAGRLDEAVAENDRAIALDPLATWGWRWRGAYLLARSQPGPARAAFERALSLSPASDPARAGLGLADLLEGRPAEALSRFEADSRAWARLWGAALARADRAGSDRALASLARDHGHTAAYQVAQVHAWRGSADLAIEWLERAHETHDPGLRSLVYDPLLRSLRSDSRYLSLVGRLGLRHP